MSYPQQGQTGYTQCPGCQGNRAQQCPSTQPGQPGYTVPQQSGFYQQFGPSFPPSGPPYGQQMGYDPISQQPGPTADGWMSIQQRVSSVPPGLEFLTTIDQLLVHQKIELWQALMRCDTKNKYTIINGLGKKVFYAIEDSGCCDRNCCGLSRPFDLKIMDSTQTELIHLHRPLACDSCCFPCCLQKIVVSAPPGTVVGSIEQQWSIRKPQFLIKNAAGDTVLRIWGPSCTYRKCGDIAELQVMSKDGKTILGKISKQWSGLLQDIFTNADYFGVTFPMDLDVPIKAVLLGACFLIDAMFFENGPGITSITGILEYILE